MRQDGDYPTKYIQPRGWLGLYQILTHLLNSLKRKENDMSITKTQLSKQHSHKRETQKDYSI